MDELMEEHQASMSAIIEQKKILQEQDTKTSLANAAVNAVNGPSSANGVQKHGQENGASGKDCSQETSKDGLEIRKGVEPGSFIDLLVRGSMRGTGESFTQNQKAQQVSNSTLTSSGLIIK